MIVHFVVLYCSSLITYEDLAQVEGDNSCPEESGNIKELCGYCRQDTSASASTLLRLCLASGQVEEVCDGCEQVCEREEYDEFVRKGAQHCELDVGEDDHAGAEDGQAGANVRDDLDRPQLLLRKCKSATHRASVFLLTEH